MQDESILDREDSQLVAGELEVNLDTLVAELERARSESEACHRRLLRRNRELAATAMVAQAISSSQLGLAETLEQALQVILEVTGLPAGWILLLPEDGGEPVMTSSAGLPQDIAEALTGFRSPECECARALQSRRPLMVQPLHVDCPIHGLDLGSGRPPVCHATVPLLTRLKVLGVLNLAGDDPILFDEQELMLLGAIGRQLGVAIENARLCEELKQRDLLRGQLLEQAITAQEDERRRIARELHDQTGQALTSLLVWLRALEVEADGSAGLTISSARVQEFKAIVAETLDGVRDLAHELRPSALDDLGLVPALQHYVRSCQDLHRLAVDFQAVGLEDVQFSPSVKTALYRIAQAALTNVAQHAKTSGVSLLLEARAKEVVLIVEDDGCGFDAAGLGRGEIDERWLGLAGMRERAELIGGRLTIESTPGAGTTVFVEVPLGKKPRGQADEE